MRVPLKRKDPAVGAHGHSAALVDPAGGDENPHPKRRDPARDILGSIRFVEPHGHSPALVDPAGGDEKPSVTNPQRKRCDNCGKLFMRTRFYARFCKASCRKEFHDAGNTAFGHVKHLYEKQHRAMLKTIADLQKRVQRLEELVITAEQSEQA